MKVYCLSLGCAKNRVDSECLAGALVKAGHELVSDVKYAEAGIVNTCGFIAPAVKESISAILDLEQLKLSGKLQKIGVVGCLVNRYDNELKKELPSVDFWANSEDWNEVVKSLGGVPYDGRCRSPLPNSANFTRYLKISEGCDNRCSYCAIPAIRGGLKSLPQEVVVREAQQLVSEGARELCVVGQDLTVYGMDQCGHSRLLELLGALETSLPANLWIRLLYLHPARVTDELLERVANSKQILSYLDIPVQHGDSRILEAMNRGMDPERLLAIFKTARAIDPDFALRTTCMVGFPGEKKEHFDNLMKFIDTVRFDRMGAFTFYPEEGTRAAEMQGQVSEKTKSQRLAKLMALQEAISLERQQLFVGRTLNVLIEDNEPEEGYAEGRSFREAPEVDGVVEVHGASLGLKSGDVVRASVKEAMVHDMIGEMIIE